MPDQSSIDHCQQTLPELTVLRPKPQHPPGNEPQQHWSLPDGRAWCVIYRLDDVTYLLRFPNLADFIAHVNGTVTCTPVAGTSQSTLSHLFANQVAPAALSLQHRFVFHGSALSIHGTGVAFFGESGRGKSTLATYLGRKGHSLLSDDGLELRFMDNELFAIPNQPSVRLWQDSQAELLPDGLVAAPSVSYTSKGRFNAQGWLPMCTDPVPFRFAFFLGDNTAKPLSITSLSLREAHMAWISNAFLLGIHDKDTIRAQFHHVARIVQTTHCYQLDYPREYALLPDVEAAVLAVVGEETASTHTVRSGT